MFFNDDNSEQHHNTNASTFFGCVVQLCNVELQAVHKDVSSTDTSDVNYTTRNHNHHANNDDIICIYEQHA